jgi:hypothetical protein
MKSPKRAFLSFLLTIAACGTSGQPAPATSTPATPVVAPAVIAAAPAEPAFVPIATAKSSMVGSLVSVAPATIVADLDALSKRLGLPMQAGQELLSSAGSLGLVGDAAHFRAVWDRLESGAPVAVVWVLQGKDKTKGYCAALTFKDDELARRTLDDLGSPGAQRGGMFERKVPDADSVWAATKGRTLLVANSPDALLAAGGLAQAAQVAPKDGQLVLSVLPKALAKASGQSNEQIVARISAALAEAAHPATVKTSEGVQRMMVGLAESLTKMALDTADLRLVFEVGPKEGVLVRADVVPAPGTDLAARIAHRSPYVFDERLPIRDDGTMALALGDLSPWFMPFAQAFEATGPAGQAMRKELTQWFGMVGDISCVVEPVAAGLTSLCSSSLKPGVDPKLAVDGAVALLTAQNAWEAELEGRKAAPLKIKRKKDTVEVAKKLQNADATTLAMAKALAGGDTVKTVIAVKSGRLVQGTGSEAADFVLHYGAVAKVEHAPIVSATLASTKGMEGVASVDVIAVLMRLFGKNKNLPGNQMASMAGSLPGVSEMKAPFVFDLRTGEALIGEFRIPLATLDSTGKVVQGLLGGPGAGQQ